VGAELILLVAAMALAIPAWRRARASRASGATGWQAFEAGLAVFVPQPIAHLIALEPRLWTCIILWLRRRPRQPGDFAYHQGSIVGVLAIAALFSAPVEILLAEVLIPWTWLRLALLVASIYAVIWIFGFAASLATIPHHLGADGIWLNYGLLATTHIPYSAIIAVTTERRSPRSGREGLTVDGHAGIAYLAIGGQTMVTLTLREPISFQRLFTASAPVQRIGLAVDDVRDFVAAITTRLEPAPVSTETVTIGG
jgi:hypothetical protein